MGITGPPQACVTSYGSRLRVQCKTALLTSTIPQVRTGKRNQHAINYSEVDEDLDDDILDENGITSNNVSASQKDEIKARPALKTRHVYRSEEQVKAEADKGEVLIPIRINLDLEQYRLSDFFLWNLSEDMISPDQFASIMCQDLDIPPQYIPQISTSIQTQIQEFAPLATIELPQEAELRVIVNLSLHLSRHLYSDRFEWDLCSGLTPEAFARVIVADLGLSGEFYPAIAHAVHESLLRLKKDVCEGHYRQEIDNDAAFGAEAGWRIDQEGLGRDWAPSVELLTQEEMERREGERERNIRRLRRDSARFGENISGNTNVSNDLYGAAKSRRRRRPLDEQYSRLSTPLRSSRGATPMNYF